jgi:predicted transglutaminase-like cysteine proteinase
LTDWELHGQEEVWSYPGVAGDCEDYVLLKRQMLIEKGFSASDLLITVVRRPDGEGHAVLTLRTSKGDFVLDNLANDVKIWTQTPYKYLKRQASFHTGRWVNIQNGNPVVVGSLR